MIIDFNDNWIYCERGGECIPVSLPHDGMICGRRDGDGVQNIGWFHGVDAQYTKHFVKPCGENFFLEFEGVYKDAEIFINGKFAASHFYGYTGFTVDVTELIHDGENTVSVSVHNSDQPNGRWYTGTGIYRPVKLYALPREYILISGISVKTLSVDPARVEVKVKTCGEGELAVALSRGNSVVCQNTVAVRGAINETSLVFDVDNPELWSVDNPALYTCRVTFCGDERELAFGIRTVSVDRQHGFTINGERVVLRGACVHHDNGILGARCYAESERRKVSLLKSCGYNAIRCAHNPCSHALLDACDTLGMLVLDEYTDMWYVHKTKYDYATRVEDNYDADLNAMIDKDFSHPSVVMYSLGNEVAESGEKRGLELLGKMIETVKKRDDRPVTVGINPFFNFLYSIGLGQYSDKKANRSPNKKVGSEFFNMLAGKFGAGFMKTMAKLRGCDKKTREAYSMCDIAGYNYGIERYDRDLKKYGGRIILGTETFCADAFDFFEKAKGNNAVIGDFVWAGMDYLGEVGVGAWEYRDYAPVPATRFGWISAGSGRIDLTGNLLGEALYTRVAFELDDIHIAASPRPIGQKHSPSAWKFSDALSFWCGEIGKTYRVEVYSRAHTVELMLNGKKLSRRRTKKARAVFRAKFEAGELTAVGYNERGEEVCRTSLHSPGEATRLYISAEQKNSRDSIYYLQIYYGDESGAWKPSARGEVSVSVAGGKLLALGNACPFNAHGYCRDVTDTYYGRALAVVETDGVATVTASDGKNTCFATVGGMAKSLND